MSKFEAKLMNSTGDVLFITTNKEIDVSGFVPGVYFLSIQIDNQIIRKKILISN